MCDRQSMSWWRATSDCVRRTRPPAAAPRTASLCASWRRSCGCPRRLRGCAAPKSSRPPTCARCCVRISRRTVLPFLLPWAGFSLRRPDTITACKCAKSRACCALHGSQMLPGFTGSFAHMWMHARVAEHAQELQSTASGFVVAQDLPSVRRRGGW